MLRRNAIAPVSPDMDPFSAIYALSRWAEMELFYRKDRSFYLVYYIDDNEKEQPMFWIDITVFKKLYDMEIVNDENVDAGDSKTAPF